MPKNFTIPCFIIFAALFFTVGCSSNTELAEQDNSNRATEVEIKVLSGELVTLAVHSISIRTENGMEYCFAIDDNTERINDDLDVGDYVEVSYATNMTSMAKSIEITES